MAIKIMKNALIISLAISFFSCGKVEEMKIEYPIELNSKTFERRLEIKGVKPKKSSIQVYNNGVKVVDGFENDYFDDEFSALIFLEVGINNLKIKNLKGDNNEVLLKEVVFVVQKEISVEEKIIKIKNDSIAQAKAMVEEREETESTQLGLEEEIKVVMEGSGIPCLDLGIAKSGCLWVYTLDNSQDRNGLAKSLCYTASKYSVQCVTIFDINQKELGRSRCK